MNKSMGDPLALLAIKTEITAHALSRFDLGRELNKGHKQNNKWRRRPESMTSYLKFIATCYPSLSPRTYTRHFRVYEKLVVNAGLSEFTLMEFDFTTLVIAAEDRDLNPPALRAIISKLKTMLKNGASQRDVRKQLRVYVERHRASIPRLIALIEESDAMILSAYSMNNEPPE